MKKRLLGIFIASLFVTTVQAAGGSFNPVLDDSFTFKLGASWLKPDGKFSSTNDNELTDKLETSDLDVDDYDVQPAISARWRFTDRWRLTFDYRKLDNEGSVQDNFDELIFGDIRARGFLAVDTKFKTDFYIAQAGYSFLKNERSELGVGAGLHIADFDTKLSVRGEIEIGDSGTFSDSFEVESVEVTAPLPNITAFGTYAFTPKLSLEGSIGFFGLDYKDYSGELLTLNASLEYRVTERFGVGVGYTYIDMDLEIDKSAKDRYELDYYGPALFATAAF